MSNPWAAIDRMKQELHAVEAAVAKYPGWVLIEPINGQHRAECKTIIGTIERASGRTARELDDAIDAIERRWDEECGL